jgi:two-component system cell cycle sensor histidine kinase/response regulator CckA
MLPSKSAGWGWRFFLSLALALFLLHAAVLLAAPRESARMLYSDLIQLALGILAASAAWRATHLSTGFTKTFWRFQRASFLLWICAQGLATVYQNVLHKPLNSPWPSDIFFFLWMTPAFLSLFLDSNARPLKKNWQQWLDFAQVGILVAAAYLFTFGVSSHWQRPGGSILKIGLSLEWIRDSTVVVLFALRYLGARSRQMRVLYGRMAIFFLLYAAAEMPFVALQAIQQLRVGTLWDLPWSLAFAAAIFLIATTPNTAQAALEPISKERRLPRHGLALLLPLVPLIFPLVVLLMAAHIAEQQFVLAVLAVLASFACSSARIFLSDRERSRSAAALEERTALLKAIFDGTSDAIFMKELDGRYILANDAASELVGRPLDEIIGKHPRELFDARTVARVIERDREVLESGHPTTFEDEVTYLKGVTRVIMTTRSPYRDGNGEIKGVVGIARDMSEYRALENRLRQSQKMEAIGTLAGGVAHDFNNILMVINGYSQMLADAMGPQPALRGHLEQIQKAGERAASLTRQLLAFSRKQTIQPEPLNLNDMVRGIEKLLHRLIGENIQVITRTAADLGLTMADAGQIEQVILNLAVNARDAMPEGGKLTLETHNVELTASSTELLGGRRPGRYVELLARDTGVGMDTTVQAHIFEPFFTTKPTGKGTGLGLSTVYGIVEQAGGFITFSSIAGEGTVFHIFLPRIDEPLAEKAPVVRTEGSARGLETVLLVEDDESVCELVRGILRAKGYKVLSAGRPQDAVALCERHGGRIDLLLTDVIMPGFSGAELSKRLTAKYPDMRVIFMSGYIDDLMVREGMHRHEVSFLQKPFTPSNLAKKVREVLDGAAKGVEH